MRVPVILGAAIAASIFASATGAEAAWCRGSNGYSYWCQRDGATQTFHASRSYQRRNSGYQTYRGYQRQSSHQSSYGFPRPVSSYTGRGVLPCL